MLDDFHNVPLGGYADLDPEARAAFAARLREGEPSSSAELLASRRLACSIEATRTLTPEERLADLVATRHVAGRLSGDEADDHARLSSDPVLGPAHAAMHERLRALDAADPVERFERLRTKADAPRTTLAIPPRAPARPPAAHGRAAAPRWRRAAVLAGVMFAVAAGIVLTLRGPGSDGLGAFTDDELNLEGYGAVRGGPGEAAVSANEQRYLRALETIASARSRFFGYDEANLRVARVDLEAVVRAEARDSFLELEASYALGKTALLLGDEAAARGALTHVVRGGGLRAPEAARILNKIGALPPRS